VLSLALPDGRKGITAAPVTVPADKKEAVISIAADAGAAPGALANVVVRAEMDFQGKAAVDAPITLNVVP
jgi:hypothetical protein